MGESDKGATRSTRERERARETQVCFMFVLHLCYVCVLFIIIFFIHVQHILTSSLPIFEVYYIGAETQEGGGRGQAVRMRAWHTVF